MTLVANIQSVESHSGMLRRHQSDSTMSSIQGYVEAQLDMDENSNEKIRGRKVQNQPKQENSDNITPDHHSSDADEDTSTRKRRRSRRGLDSKFVCPQKNCGRKYSRAEHL